jgi:iron-sulfur cluster repair protein YtfE (RIC family)
METPEKTFVEALHEEHVDLFRQLQKLEDVLGKAQAPAELSRHLGMVRTLITDHFHFEEDGGYMAPLLNEEPRFGALVRELLAEHQQMTKALDAIIQELRGAASVRDVARDRVRAWVKQLHHHEARENGLVQEAYYSTGATGD